MVFQRRPGNADYWVYARGGLGQITYCEEKNCGIDEDASLRPVVFILNEIYRPKVLKGAIALWKYRQHAK
eukprot:5540917-Pleurochrysis_carterae.AAC.1